MTTNINQHRPAFEEACRAHAEEAGHDDEPNLTRDGEGYADPATQAAWWGWREGTDRQGRGDPAAWLRNERGDYEGMAVFDPLLLLSEPAPGFFVATYSPVFSAPQPAEPAIKESLTVAEPVKEASNEEILDLAPAIGILATSNTVGFARALLASYGKAAQPIMPEPTPEMLDRAVAFALNVKISAEYGWTQYMRDLWAHMTAAASSDGQAQQENPQ